MPKTIFIRYFWRSLILLTVTTLTLTISFVFSASRVLRAQQEIKMMAAAQSMRTYMTPRLTFQGLHIELAEEIRNVMPLIADIGDMRLLLCDADGLVVLDSGAPDATPGAREPPDEPEGLLRISVPLSIQISTMSGSEEVTVGTILISSHQNTPLLLQFFHNWLLMSVIVVVLSGVTAYFSAARQTRPLRQMASCARSFELGDFSARADAALLRDDEIHDLAQAFNGMAETLQRGEELRRGFISDISHELKTPMTTISGFIGGVLDGTVPEERREETLLIVQEEVMRLSRLVESSASLSRLQTGQLELHPRPFDVSELSLRVLAGLEGRVEEKGLIVCLDLPEPGTNLVMADPDPITQVLTNLLDNAVKFSSPGGELRLSVRPLGGKTRISVANQGQTIPPDDLPYIFERFYKADRSRSKDKSGLGLGLFLVRSILNAHNEDITVISENGLTEFSFTLPECRLQKGM